MLVYSNKSQECCHGNRLSDFTHPEYIDWVLQRFRGRGVAEWATVTYYLAFENQVDLIHLVLGPAWGWV